MAYQQITLTDFIAQVSSLMDDPAQRYWTYDEIKYATYEALLYWGAITSYWRARGTFNAPATPVAFSGMGNTPTYFDLSVKLPDLRQRNVTLDQMVRQVQWALLEAANGISGAGMSGQVSVDSILTAIKDARNRLVLDLRLPLTAHAQIADSPSPDGIVSFSQDSVYVHRTAWQDISGRWTPLWRQDSWAADRNSPYWTLEPGSPTVYSESDLAPLQLELIPAPVSVGTLQALTVDSLDLDTTDQNATFDIPNEWMHAVKYAALAQILSSAGQIADPLRSEYCEQRYQQSVQLARACTSILRVTVNGVPLPIDSITAIDLAYPNWMNQIGAPFMGGVAYDMLTLCPGLQDSTYGIAVDVAQSAPLPDSNNYMPVGREEMDNLFDYVGHILTFKCGGKDFTSTIGGYDSFMRHAANRGNINKAKIQYLEPIFNQPQREWAMRQDKVESNG